jgi:hypothetical protein
VTRPANRPTYLKDYPTVEAVLRKCEKNPDAHAEFMAFLGDLDGMTPRQLKQTLDIAEQIARGPRARGEL